MIEDKYRARVLEAMEAEYGPAETPEQEEQLLGTLSAEMMALALAFADFEQALTESFRPAEKFLRQVANVFRKVVTHQRP